MFEPDDGEVTKPSLLARQSLDPTLFPLAYAFFPSGPGFLRLPRIALALRYACPGAGYRREEYWRNSRATRDWCERSAH
jgi:hypothetical protein